MSNLERKSTTQTSGGNDEAGIFTFGSGSSYKMGAEAISHESSVPARPKESATIASPYTIEKKYTSEYADRDAKERTPKSVKRGESSSSAYEQYQRVPIFKSFLLETLAQKEKEQAQMAQEKYGKDSGAPSTSVGPQLKTLADANL